MSVTDDARLRELERAVSSGDEVAARELLAHAARAGLFAALAEGLAAETIGGRPVLGPLFPHEADRLSEVSPKALVLDVRGNGWVLAEPRSLMGAVLHVRLVELETKGPQVPRSFASRAALHAAVDVFGKDAIERLGRVVETGPHEAAEWAAELLAERPEPLAGRRLARVAAEAPSEARSRAYRALAGGRVPIDAGTRALLGGALTREPTFMRRFAFAAFARTASARELEELRAHGSSPDLRALAFEALVERVKRATGQRRAGSLERRRSALLDVVRKALADDAKELRRAAVRVLAGDEWAKDPRARGWLMSRLLDSDNTVRVSATRLLRQRDLAAREAPRLRLIAEGAPPSLRPPIERLAERADRPRPRSS